MYIREDYHVVFYIVFITVVVPCHSGRSLRRRVWTLPPRKVARRPVSCAVDSSPCDVCRPDVYRSRKCEENRHKRSGVRLHTHNHIDMHVVCQHPLLKISAFVNCPYLMKYVDS
jgi:hypothetical protein